MIREMLFSEKRIVQKTYFWNLAANVLYALQSVLLLFVISRYGTLEEAGVFSIIYTTTHMLSTLGNYSMRNFQVSDAENEYSFSNYWTSRIISCGLMVLAGMIYGVVRYGFNDYLLIVLLFVGYRVTDCIEDVVHGLAQKEGRLDAASCVKTIRVVISSVVFSAVYIVTKSLVFATASMLVVSVFIVLYTTWIFTRVFPALKYSLQFSKTWKLLWVCLPLCASALIQTYIINSPKYAIDRLMSSETQAIFGFLFMPVFSINLLVMFIFNPLVANLSQLWVEGEINKFRRIIFRQILIISGFTVFAAVCSYLFGCELLGWFYGVQLTEHKVFLMILMFFGGIAALSTFMSIVITIMRKQKEIMISYCIAMVFSFLFSDMMVRNYGMEGAGYLYGLLMAVILISLTITVIRGFGQARKRENIAKES